MALKDVAVQGCTVDVNDTGNTGTVTVTSSPSTKVKATNGVYFKQLDVSIAGCTSGTCVQGAPVKDSIMPTAQKVKADGDLVMRVNDKKEQIVINGTDSGSGLPCAFTVDVEITDAGQSKVKAQ